MRFIHTADIHLDSPLTGLETYEDAPVDEIRGATRRAFDNLVDLAIEEKVDFVLIAGDLYDGDWKDYNTGLFFVSRMGRLEREGIEVFLVSGNHDAASQITRALPLPGNVTRFSPKKPESITREDLGVIIHGQSYSSRDVSENLAANYPERRADYFNIGLLHTSLNGREGHENYAPCSPDDLKAKGYDYWALGHVHARETISEDPWIVFPGNIQGRHIRETGAKGATVVTVEDGSIVGVEHRELDVLRWVQCEVDVSGCETPNSVYDAIRQGFAQELAQADDRPLALRLVLTGKSPLHSKLLERPEVWTEEFRGITAGLGNVWLEKVLYRTERAARLEEIIGEDTPLSGVLLAVDSLEFDEKNLTAFIPELTNLKTKLPPEFQNLDVLLESQPEHFSALREEIKELLIAKLIQHGGEA